MAISRFVNTYFLFILYKCPQETRTVSQHIHLPLIGLARTHYSVLMSS